jgi:proteasome lid subunit RPN8/RPN11
MDSGPSRAHASLILLIPESIAGRLAAHAQSAYPRECCGFILGEDCDGELYVENILPIENIASENDRFMMAPESVLMAEQTARVEKKEILAIYHSHPDGDGTPSATDRQEAMPGMPQVILSISADGTCFAAAWMPAEDGRFLIAGIAVAAHE